jgi:putative oxidoreductase
MKRFSLKPETALDITALILRIAAALMLRHGWNKLIHFSENATDFDDPLHVSPAVSLSLTIFAEFFCTFFIIAGLFTRIAVIPLVICFVVIFFVIHAADPLKEKEEALLYLLLYLAIFFAGSGKYSLDRLIRKL